MPGQIPANPKIYHIVHVDRLASIINQGCLWSHATIQLTPLPGTTIGMSTIKERRLTTTLNSFPNLNVGDCVPFYFCPRSIMLYLFHVNNHQEITYRGGQSPIIHLQADLHQSVQWANQNNKRWAFTDSNAGSYYFNDFNSLGELNNIDWNAVHSRFWSGCKENKQAEFLLEDQFPWSLIEHIGVYSPAEYQQVNTILHSTLNTVAHQPPISIKPNWYY